MIGKLPKSEAWKQSDPNRPGHRLHPRYSSGESLSESTGFWQSFHTRATRVENPCRTPKDSDKASTPELRGGLPIGQEAFRPSEPYHSPDKATPIYYTKNVSFTSGISKVWCVYRLSP
jgi:hypothetical protein